MDETIHRTIERLNQIANHFVLCSHCENCRKAQYIVQAIDHIRGDLDRALLPKKLPVLFTDPVFRERAEMQHVSFLNSESVKTLRRG